MAKKNRFGKSITVTHDEYVATSGIALQAWKDGEPYATLTVCVPDIPLEKDEIILNHDILLNAMLTTEFLDYMCDTTGGIKRVKYGYAESYIVKLREDWKDLCESTAYMEGDEEIMNKTMRFAYKDYLESDMLDLRDAYKTCSTKKHQAWTNCKDVMESYGGRDLRVIRANTFAFSAGFVFEEDGVKKFAYITKDNVRTAVID